VIEMALREVRMARSVVPDASIAVNLSPQDLLDESLPETVIAMVAAAGVPTSALHLEVTEGSVMTEPERAIVLLRRPARQPHGVEHAAVVGDEQHRAVEATRAPVRAARSPAGRGGWSARRAPAGWCRAPAAAPARRGCARPATTRRRNGSRRPGRCPNFASSVRTSAVAQSGTVAAEHVEQRQCRRRTQARAWSISPTTTPARARRCPTVGATRPSSSASSVLLPPPFGPVIATRSRTRELQVDGAERNVADAARGAARRATTSPDRGALAIVNCSTHSLRGASTASSRSIKPSRSARTLPACFSVCLDAERAAHLVVVALPCAARS
jgi:hypothetical protein